MAYYDIHWIPGGEMKELRERKIRGIPVYASVDADGNVVFWPYPGPLMEFDFALKLNSKEKP